MSTTKERQLPDLSRCPCSGGTLDKLLQPAILAVLTEGPIHGYALVARIGAMPGFAGHKPDVSGVYRLLKGMERRALVVPAWDLSESGPAKKTYQITKEGRRCLRQWVRTLEKYHEGIAALLDIARRAAKK